MLVMLQGKESLFLDWSSNQARCKKPVKRLWISSMEDRAIKEGFT